MPQVVAQVELVEIKRCEEGGEVWRRVRRAKECECEVGSGAGEGKGVSLEVCGFRGGEG